MRLEEVRELSESLTGELAALYGRAAEEDRTVFHDPFFLLACWNSAPADTDRFGLLWRDDAGACVGAALFKHAAVSLAGKSRRCVVPITFRITDFTPVLAAAEHRERWMEALLDRLCAGASPAVLPMLRESEARVAARRAGWLPHGEVVNPVALDRDQPFAKVVSKKSMKVAANQMGRMGRLEISHHTRDHPAGVLDELAALHRERWAFDGSPSKLAEPFFQALYRELLATYPSRAMEGNALLVSVARLDGVAVAVHLGFRWGATLLYHLPAVNLAYLDASPGQVLLRAVFEYAAREGMECFDMGFGEEPYKERYATERRVYRGFVCARGADRARLRLKERLSGGTPGRLARLLRGGAGALPRRALRAARRAASTRRMIVFSREGAAGESAGDLVELGFGEMVALARGPGVFPYTLRRRLHDRYREGYRFFALRVEGELVSFAWAVRAPELEISEVECTLRAGGEVGWITDCATPPEFRGRGYYPRLLEKICDVIGTGTVLIYCLAENHASRRGIEKAGFARVGEIVRVAGRSRLRGVAAGAPPLGLAGRGGR